MAVALLKVFFVATLLYLKEPPLSSILWPEPVEK